MSDWVLDSSALLAVVKNEPGREGVEEALHSGAAMSVVNVSEVVSRLADDGKSQTEIESLLNRFDIEIYPFDERSAWMTGLLRPSTREAGLSFGDRACLALAIELQLPVLTGDHPWSRVNLGGKVAIRFFR